METLLQDVRYSIRTLVKAPAFTAVAVIALALGIGANTAIFSVVNSLLLRPLHFDEPDRLVQVWETNLKKGGSNIPASYPDFSDWRDQNQVFEQVVAYSDWSFNLTGVDNPERISGDVVTPTFFSTLGIKPILGRLFLPDEDTPEKDNVVIINDHLWQRRFNRDPNIIDKTITLNDELFTVIGVIPTGAQLPLQAADDELWVPVSHADGLKNRRGHFLGVVARLRPGVTIEQAQADMDAVASRLTAQYPESNTDINIRVVALHEQIVGKLKTLLYVLLGAVAFVLLIASANVANMLLARAARRQKEIAIRSALGARRSRLVRQLLTESLMLAVVGGTFGLLIALWGIDLLVASGPSDLPRVKEVSVDARVLGFTIAVSLLTGMIFGIVPALQASKPNLNEMLKEGGRASSGPARQRVRNGLVIAEIALSLVLLVGAGLLVKSFIALQSVDPGFNSRNVLTMRLDLSGPNFKTGASVIQFHSQLLERIESIAGVQSASTRTFAPIAADASWARLAFFIEGHAIDYSNRPVAFYNTVSTKYFQTMQIALVSGREFNENDVRKARTVAIINETLAARYFPGLDPVGKRLTLNDENPTEEEWATIVGVVRDTKQRALEAEPVPELYMPFAQQPEGIMTLMIRTTADPTSVASAVRNEVLAMDKDQPVYSIRTLDSILSESVASPRFRTLLFAIFASVAVVLAAVGIYGVMSYSVTQRTHEIGIRMALGAEANDVLRLVVGQGLLLALIGVAIGIVASFFLTKLLTSLLFGVTATDTLTFVVIPVILTGVALGACFIPARRATRIDPMEALRYE